MKETPEAESPLNDEVNSPKQNEEISLSNASHPTACLFTFLFKATAFAIYLLLFGFFDDIEVFIIVVLLGAVDFWVVKNVTGRLLVGLRWWSDFDDDGREIWRYESYDQQFDANVVDKTFFWMSQLIATGAWAFFLVIKVLSLSAFWSLCVFIMFSLCATNLYGYYKCRGDHNDKVQKYKEQIAKKGGKMFFSKFFS